MKRLTPRLDAWLVLLVAALTSGCGRAATSAGPEATLVLTRAPAGAVRLHPEPGERIPLGSQVVALDPTDPERSVREISSGLTRAGHPSLTIDGRRVLFAGVAPGEETFSLFEAAVDGSKRRRLVGPPYNCSSAAELPDGRVVFAAAVDDSVPPPSMSFAWALFVLSPDEGSIERITFSGQTELDPYVLSDGRILYSQWLPPGDGRPPGGAFALFTVHSDGTGMAPLLGHHDGARWKLRPRQSTSGDIFFVAAEAGVSSEIRGARWTAPVETGFPVSLREGQPFAVEPTAEGPLLVAVTAAGANPGGILRVTQEGRSAELVLPSDPAWDFLEAVWVAPRPRPQGHLSMIDPEGDRGLLLAVESRPADPSARRAAVAARLEIAGTRSAETRPLGEVPLAADGSFFASVPANVPLRIDLLDAEGNTLVESVTPFWVRPKEIRGCVGCHEDPETAPPNRRPLAVLGEPTDLVGDGG